MENHKMVNIKTGLIIFFAAKEEALYSQQKGKREKERYTYLNAEFQNER